MIKTEARVFGGKTYVTVWVPQASCSLLEVFHLKLDLDFLYSPVTPDFEVVSYASVMAQQLKNPPANAGNASSTPGSGRSLGKENGSPLQYSSLRNPMDRGA